MDAHKKIPLVECLLVRQSSAKEDARICKGMTIYKDTGSVAPLFCVQAYVTAPSL